VVNGGDRVRLEGLTVRNARQLGIQMLGGKNHTISGCDIYETGEGGINAEGGTRATLTPAGHVVSNNHIHHFAIHRLCYANGIRLGGVGNLATHNLLHDAPHQAVSVSGNDHVFEYNELHDVCMASDDAGAFYKGRNPSMRGNVVRYNFWHHIGSPMGHGNAAIYFDDGDGGESVIGNVFFKCGEPGKGSFGTIFSHGGHDNRSEGNIFVACKRPLGSSPWNDKRWENYLKTELLAKMTKEVDITQPPFTTRSPEVEGIMTPQDGAVRKNRASNNVLVGCGEVSSGNWEIADNNPEFESDPGFMDPVHGDFRFKKNSAVFTQLPGFKNPPIPQMGLVRDTVRTSLPPPSFVYDPQDVKSMKAARASIAAASRKGPAPVAKVSRGSFEGSEILSEQDLGKPQIILAREVGGTPSKMTSRAWMRYDDKTLQVYIDNAVEKGTSFKGNHWGSCEAVEVALRLVGREKSDPIIVFRGFANGNLQFGQCKNAGDEPILSDPNGAVYQAFTPRVDRWIARLSIPATLLGWTPASGQRLAFNITARKVKSDLWLMWEPTRAHSYDVDMAGIVELSR
ncbi:MAG: right-handed parallel beta-helix repeat-containing protein, partial [Spirochaetia bacterium]|nr:right-handed parallel beta-helix repeat-containing protein [Spirochaetia bacterium]